MLANSQVNAIAEYFLLKTAMNQTLLKTRFEITGSTAFYQVNQFGRPNLHIHRTHILNEARVFTFKLF